MKMDEIKGLSADQLKDKLVEARKEQMNLRFQKASGTLENHNRWREVRTDIARMKTEMSARNNAAAN